jgi:tetratricopeptide (TPR) repeat protein
MRTVVKCLLCLVFWPTLSQGEEQAVAPLTSDDLALVRRFLEQADAGSLDRGPLQKREFRQKLVAYYLRGAGTISIRAELSVGLSFVAEKRYLEGIKLLTSYTQAYSNDWDGLYVLGMALTESGAYGRAIRALTNAAAFARTDDPRHEPGGEPTMTFSHLAIAALLSGRPELIGGIAPRLLQATPAQFFSEGVRLRTATALAWYALSVQDLSLFVGATSAGTSTQASTSDPDVRQCLQLGCYLFPRAEELGPLRRALLDGAWKTLPPPAGDTLPISSSQVEAIRRRLADEANGNTDLYSSVDEELCRCLMAYYLAKTNPVPDRAKLAIARCFGRAGLLAAAASLAREYGSVFSNDWRAWKIIGQASYQAQAYGHGYEALQRAIALGAADAAELYPHLAMCAFMSGHLEAVGPVVPILTLRADARTDQDTRSTIDAEILLYAIAARNEDLFVKALEGTPVDAILGSKPLRVLFLIGHGLFQAKEVEPLWQAYRKAAWDEEPRAN